MPNVENPVNAKIGSELEAGIQPGGGCGEPVEQGSGELASFLLACAGV